MVIKNGHSHAIHAGGSTQTPSVNSHVALLTSVDLIEDYILFRNVYSVNFKGAKKTLNGNVQVPYFTPELESAALNDFEISNKKITESEDDASVSYPRIRRYLVSLFGDNAEESLHIFSTLSLTEKTLIRTSIQHLRQQIRENSSTRQA
ncbi:hypothetical protein XU18_1256 [Perkinsela sp. CCAP 1560/4]|nr:hypothetical protein XU18_1256 [Perkinsela sp. CCAP 1560/4]|eukprot:KNH08248.1 hypothetical protein XU18_1256 [Perkinsela sp. CCAP 1560/4]